MITLSTIADLRAALDIERAAGRSIGFVPTMGFLHDGHASLIDASVAANQVTVLSIFVNPSQFAPDEDLDRYPSDPEGDSALAEERGTAFLFVPTVDEMYPQPSLTTVRVAGIPDHLEGASRPSHFAGVATVVTKLFNIVQPDRAYFGEKDYQQVAMIRRMAADLDQRVDVIACPTRRHADGLAMSSRNVHLSSDERSAASALYRALRDGATAVEEGETSAAAVKAIMAAVIDEQSFGRRDYVEVADAETCEPVSSAVPGVRLFGAVQFERARLIDNVGTGQSAD